MPGSAGIATPVVLFTQSFKSIPCFGSAPHIGGVLAVLADMGFFGLVCILSMLGMSGSYIKVGLGSW